MPKYANSAKVMYGLHSNAETMLRFCLYKYPFAFLEPSTILIELKDSGLHEYNKGTDCQEIVSNIRK